jgi:hypothetical protein
MSNDIRMFAAGYIEGVLTCVRLSQYYNNFEKLILRADTAKHSMANVRQLLKHQLEFLKVKTNVIPSVLPEEPEEDYWKQARYSLFQLWGMTDGYNFAAAHFRTNKLALLDMMFLNSAGELGALLDAYTPKAAADREAAHNEDAEALKSIQARGRLALLQRGRRNSTFLQRPLKDSDQHVKENWLDGVDWRRRVAESGHCSALVHLAPGNKDLFVGHTTWDDYSKMTRIFKHYAFPLGEGVMTTKMSFSSYPGLIGSADNFYVMDSGLQVMDTTLVNLNPLLWDKVLDFPWSPHIPNFVHLTVTNRLAKSPAHWARIFSKQNTGTMNSQWMIVDYNRFTPEKQVTDNTFWVLEAVPGVIHAEDMSHHLRQHGYWPSFNRPYFDDVREASGFVAAQRTRGAMYSWLNNPRAKIFRESASTQDTLAELRALMTRNMWYGYPSDPNHDISARMDLDQQMPLPNGGIDAKVTNAVLFRQLHVQAISGPTRGGFVPPFKWTDTGLANGTDLWPAYPHKGLPNLWKFDWVQMTPYGTSAICDDGSCPVQSSLEQ